ncbi:MAG: hypothetical protein J6S50_07080 [Oscillospiraceae bacterium]|nr:hypothetical protein [Oscillospiraceae bacterium]MBP5167644.1 hypothetical protein [Oscillospiraceae bacterium]
MEKKKFGIFRYLVPGFLFQSVVIGGGYGTGNEIAQYFGIHGMGAGIVGMIVTTLVWAVVAAATFEFCRVFKTYDYNTMSQKLLGPVGYLYEVCYIILMLIVLGVINATASSMISDLTGWTGWIGVIILSLGIIYLILRGTETIEKVLSFWSYVLYAVYAVFMITCFVRFGPMISEAFGAGRGEYTKEFINASGETIVSTIGGLSLGSAIVDGFKYSFYNLGIVPAILYTVRECETRKQAVLCGLLAGVIGVVPAFLLLLAMGGALPEAVFNANNNGTAVSAIFAKLDMRWLYVIFEIVLFGTLIETGSGFIKAVDDRIEISAAKSGESTPTWVRPVVAVGLTLLGVAVSTFGLTGLIAKGYGTICWGFLIVYVIPMLTIGIYKIVKADK